MIIRAVRAENLLKYAQLTLNGLPEAGLIGISGPNESGKSSIGEILCFGLFGRSYAVAPEALSELLKWGERAGLVEVDFGDGAGGEYTVSRYLDADGVQSASLARAGEVLVRGVASVDAAVSELLGLSYGEFIDTFYLAQREILLPHAQGATVRSIVGLNRLGRVGEVLEGELGREREAIERLKREVAQLRLQVMELNVEEGVLGRLEAERAGAESGIGQAEQEAAGLIDAQAAVQRAFDQLRQAIDGVLAIDMEATSKTWRERLQPVSAALAALERTCQEAGVEVGVEAEGGMAQNLKGLLGRANKYLDGFERLRKQAETYRRHLTGLLGETAEGGTPLPELRSELASDAEQLTRRRGSARFVAGLFLIIALALWGIWALLAFMPDQPMAQQAAAWLQPYIAQWQPPLGPPRWPGVAVVAGLITLLDLLFFARAASFNNGLEETQERIATLDTRIESVREQVEALDHLDSLPLPDAVAGIRRASTERLTRALDEFTGTIDNPLLDPRSRAEFREKLRGALGAVQQETAQIEAEIGRRADAARRRIEEHRAAIVHLDDTLRENHERRRQADAIMAIAAEVQSKISGHEDQIMVRNAAQKIVADMSQHVATRFNRRLRDNISHIMPLMTDGRYQHLQIDENLEPRVFSSDKNDFMSLDEISSGTQRQVTLAVRLALAEALAQAAAQGRQFMVLDEPFAFFDQQRTRSSLQALPKISRHFTQFWIIAQQFEEDMPFDVHLRCSRESDMLMAAGT